MANAIIPENQNTGTTAWQIPGGNGATTQIQGYCDQCSYNPGDTITFYISTQSTGTTYSINIYRLGYYRGTGGRLMTSITGQVGVAQGYANTDGSLVSCPTAMIDSTTHLCEARWASSYTFAIPGNWPTGSYEAMLVDANGKSWYVPFVVRGSSTSDYLVIRPTNTDAAYNFWGGNSVYPADSIGGIKAYKVSFDRPHINHYGSAGSIFYEACIIQWLEQQGYDLCYLTQTDIDKTPSLLNGHKALVSIGHDEYWSLAQRNGFEAAIAQGISCFFTSADTCQWQVRFETGGQNGDHRTLTAYKVSTTYSTDGYSNPTIDPLYSVGNTGGTNNQVCAQWFDSILNRPEEAMIGVRIQSYINPPYQGWTVDTNADTTYLAGTGLVKGQTYGTDLCGYEWDTIAASSPANIKTIATSVIAADAHGNPGTQKTTWYKASSGALVFASGSVQLSWALAPFRWSASNVAVIPGIQVLFANIMGALKGPVYGNLGH